MTIEEFLKEDSSFNESMFLSKVNNIFIKLFTGVMLDNLDEVKHFLSDDVYNYYSDRVKELREQNRIQMYDELNVKSSKIVTIVKEEDKYVINVFLEARYMNYIIDSETGNCIYGNNDRRMQVDYSLRFVKKIDTLNYEMIRRCPNCGKGMDINNSGKCDYCGSIYNYEDFDWILDNIK